MKHFSKILSVCIWVGLIAYACHEWKDRPDSEEPQPLTIKEAKAWYENTQPAVVLFGQKDTSNLKSAISEKTVNVAYWNMAKLKDNDIFSVVEVPVYSNQNKFIIHGGNLPDNLAEQPGITRLVIRRNLTTGITDAFVLTFTGDSSFLAQPNFKRNLFRNRFLSRKSDFSGTEVISSLEGDFLKGYIIENGRRINSFTIGKSTDSGILKTLKNGYVCDHETLFFGYWHCYGVVDFDEGSVEIDCEWEVETIIADIICDDDDDDEPCYDYCSCYGIGCGSGGGGGTGNNGNNGGSGTPNYRLVENNSLPTEQLDSLKKSMEILSQDCFFQSMNDLFDTQNYDSFSDIFVDPTMVGDAKVSVDRILRVGWEEIFNPHHDSLNLYRIREEVFHLYQLNKYNITSNTALNKVTGYIEFEAKLMQDITAYNAGKGSEHPYALKDAHDTIQVKYDVWLDELTDSKTKWPNSVNFTEFDKWARLFAATNQQYQIGLKFDKILLPEAFESVVNNSNCLRNYL